MTASDLLPYLILKLEESGIPYALGGSVASMVYGEPRAILDIDVVVTLGADRGEARVLAERYGFREEWDRVRPRK